jgi:hypothetical protein
MLARSREMEARAFLARKAAAPARRGPRGKAEPILINGLEPLEFLRRSGATYEWQIPEGVLGRYSRCWFESLPARPQTGLR